MVGYNSARLYVLNPATGIATPVGDAADFGVGEDLPTGLTSHRGVLYLAGGWTAKLYTLDAETGIASPVGNEDEDVSLFGVDEDAPTGLASLMREVSARRTVPVVNVIKE